MLYRQTQNHMPIPGLCLIVSRRAFKSPVPILFRAVYNCTYGDDAPGSDIKYQAVHL